MPVPIQKFREIILQLLYSYDIGQSEDDDLVPLIMQEVAVSKRIVKEAQLKAKQVLDKRLEIDHIISKTCSSYSFERIHSVERNVLRLGVYEILHDPNIPPKVAIAEAIRLAKKFGSPESITFVNAILDNVFNHQQETIVDSK